MAEAQQLTLFDSPPAIRHKPKVVKPQKATPALPPVAPLNLRQETALWLVGQRSIAEQRGQRYVPESVKHPGKMWPDLAGAIIDTYTKPGDVILDPMLGIGTTAVEAAERGRNVVGVEIVQHWANVARANADLTSRRGAPGSIRVINGDSRRLPELVAGVFDNLVTSPPYGEALDPRAGRVEGREERLRQLAAEGKELRGNWRFSDGQCAMMDPSYTPVDAVVTSPPYADSLNQSPAASDAEARRRRLEAAGHDDYRFGPNSAQAQPQRYDAVVTSPPYADTTLTPDLYHGLHFGRDPEDVDRKREREDGVRVGYDAVVTSPAYGDIRQDGGAHRFGEGSAMTNYTGEDRIRRGRDRSNVGNLKYGSMERALAIIARLKAGEEIPESEWPAMEYLETMALIYWHCLHLVRPGGLAVLVLKDYRRDKQRVNLVGDTIRLMTEVGWIYHDQALAVTSTIAGRVRWKGLTWRQVRRRFRGRIRYAIEHRVVAKVSPFVRINTRKQDKMGGPVLLPAGEIVLVFRKEG